MQQQIEKAQQDEKSAMVGNASGQSNIQVLTFTLGEESYGINILNIKEIVDFVGVTTVPMMHASIAGVINLRGSVVPVVELSSRLFQQSSKRTRKSGIVILEVKHEEETLEIGVTVDVVSEVLDFNSNDIKPAPSFGTSIRPDFISGILKIDDQMLVLLDIDHILSIDELSVVRE